MAPKRRTALVKPSFEFDYKDPTTLSRFLKPTGQIIPRRISRLTGYQQRHLSVAIKRARQLALLPYCGSHLNH
ncbi:MAG: 30S ribosomal protein S18 [Deltaproteobacteria bacterium]|nr:30S ribosomal protein S18 [Deltaproteobacteria bacterium]